MKFLLLIRHAKSSWEQPELEDFDRPLNKRGEADASFMGQKIKHEIGKPDVCISSPALRAMETVRIIANELNFPTNEIITHLGIYGSDEKYLLDIVRKFSDNIQTVYLCGHNPGITDFARYLGADNIKKVPTCGVVYLGFDIERWEAVEKESGKLLFFGNPKKYRAK